MIPAGRITSIWRYPVKSMQGERLSEAADRGLWSEPDPEIIAAMQRVYLELEGDLEDR